MFHRYGWVYPGCKHRSGRGWRCHAGGWWFGYCFDHLLGRLRFERKIGPIWISVDLSNVSFPRIRWDDERPPHYAGFEVSTDGCDPAVSIMWEP